MNTDTYQNGCYNRKPFIVAVLVQNGWFISSVARVGKMATYPFRMSINCEYIKTTLGQADKGCIGCKWKLRNEMHLQKR